MASHPLKSKLLTLCKDLVKKQGWNDRVLAWACEELEISTAASRGVLPNGIIEVAEDLMKEWENNMAVDVKLQDIEGKKFEDQVFYVMQKRLSYEAEYMPLWREAMIIGIEPRNIASIYQRLFYTMNTACDILGDRTTGAEWYIKRGVFGKVFVTTEVFMTRDGSEGFNNTWEYLERQVRGLDHQTFSHFGELGIWGFYNIIRSLNIKI